MMLTFGMIGIGSAQYRESFQLRDNVLRKPLGIQFTADEMDRERGSFHLAALDDKRVVGILLMTPLGIKQCKMRQVAVAPDRQNLGIGKQLVRFSEAWAQKEGFEVIVLNARKEAVPFYKNLDYKMVSDQFTEVGIPHYKMSKKLK